MNLTEYALSQVRNLLISGTLEDVREKVFSAVGRDENSFWALIAGYCFADVPLVGLPDRSIRFRRTAYILSKEFAERSTQNSFRDGLLLCLLDASASADTSTKINLLSAVESYFIQAPSDAKKLTWSHFSRLALASVETAEPLLQIGLLYTLTAIAKADHFPFVLHRPAALAILEKLDQATEGDRLGLDDDSKLVSALRNRAEKDSVTSAPLLLKKLILDIEWAVDFEFSAHEVGESIVNTLSPFLARLRHLQIEEAACHRSAISGASVQVIRVSGDTPRVKLVQALFNVVSSIVQLDDFDPTMPFPPETLTVAACSPASFPLEFSLNKEGSDMLLSVFSRARDGLISWDGDLGESTSELPDLAIRLIELASEDEQDVRLLVADASARDWLTSVDLLVPSARKSQIVDFARNFRIRANTSRLRISSRSVPQANNLDQVFEIVEVVSAFGEADISRLTDIDTPRQVLYYRHAARILGLFDDDDYVTERGRSLIGLDAIGRKRLAVVYFEDSLVGRAWRRWANGRYLTDVDASSAVAFLVDCVHGLSKNTASRRASTLERWHNELVPYHYSHPE